MASKKGTKKRVKEKSAPASDEQAAAEKFTRDLLIRGDAQRLGTDGKLPLDATHEIVGEKKDAEGVSPILKRRRFKLW